MKQFVRLILSNGIEITMPCALLNENAVCLEDIVFCDNISKSVDTTSVTQEIEKLLVCVISARKRLIEEQQKRLMQEQQRLEREARKAEREEKKRLLEQTREERERKRQERREYWDKKWQERARKRNSRPLTDSVIHSVISLLAQKEFSQDLWNEVADKFPFYSIELEKHKEQLVAKALKKRKRDYYRKCRDLTEEIKDFVPDIEKRKFGEYDLDHIVPLYYGFKYNIPVELMGSLENLQIVSHKENFEKNMFLTRKSKEILSRWGYPIDETFDFKNAKL